MKTALILVWLGPWKPWINLYVESCRRNPGFDFLIYTDQPIPAASAANVRFLPASRGWLEQRIRERLGLDATLRKAYKMCDYKPAYGLLFAEELAGYSHWGYCDEDLLWGRLHRFITPKLLAEHHVVTSCLCCIVGQLTIFQNTRLANELVTRVPDWREILLRPNTENLAETLIDRQARLEEAAGTLRVSRRQIQIHDEHDVEWNHWANQISLRETGKAVGTLKHGTAIWRDGAIYHAETMEEFAFFHFKKWKKHWRLPDLPPIPAELNQWTLSRGGIRIRSTRTPGAAARRYLSAYQRAAWITRARRVVDDRVLGARRLMDRVQRGLARRGWVRTRSA